MSGMGNTLASQSNATQSNLGPAEQFHSFRAYKIPGSQCGKLIEQADGSLRSTTGTDQSGNYIPAYTSRGLNAGRSNTTSVLRNEQEAIRLLELTPTARKDHYGREVYARVGFRGDYTLLKGVDGSVRVHFAGGYHASQPQKRMPPQTFHNGRWDLQLRAAISADDSLFPSRAQGSGPVAPGGQPLPGKGQNGTNGSGGGRTVAGGTGGSAPEPHKPEIAAALPAPQPKRQASVPPVDIVTSDTAPTESPDGGGQQPPVPAPQPADPSANAVPQDRGPKQREAKEDLPKIESVRDPKQERPQQPNFDIFSKAQIDRIWDKIAGAYEWRNFFIEPNTPPPKEQGSVSSTPVPLDTPPREKTESAATTNEAEAATPAPTPPQVPTLPAEVHQQMEYYRASIQHIEQQMSEIGRQKAAFVASEDYQNAKNEARNKRNEAEELEREMDGRGWYDPRGWKLLSYSLEWRYRDAEAAEARFSVFLDQEREIGQQRNQFFSVLKDEKEALQRLEERYKGYQAPPP